MYVFMHVCIMYPCFSALVHVCSSVCVYVYSSCLLVSCLVVLGRVLSRLYACVVFGFFWCSLCYLAISPVLIFFSLECLTCYRWGIIVSRLLYEGFMQHWFVVLAADLYGCNEALRVCLLKTVCQAWVS